MSPVYANEPAPALTVQTTSGETFDLAEQNPENFTIVVFYRGRHCPICIGQLKEVEALFEKATKQGMNLIAISMDTKERALETIALATASTLGEGDEKKEASLRLPIGYGLTEEQARNWGLYMSHGIAESSEPAAFSEPGMYAIRPDNIVSFAQTQSAPFTRPSFESLLGGLEYVVANDYPIRGTFTKKE